MFNNGILRKEDQNGDSQFYLFGFIKLPKETGIKWFYNGSEPVYTSYGIYQ